MGFLDFVKKDDGIQMASHLLGELAAFFVANVAWRRANQPRYAVLLHVLAHVDADHQLLVVEEKFRQGTREFRFSHTGGSKKNERADGALGVRESSAAAAHGVGHTREGIFLTDHALSQAFFHVDELLRFALKQPSGWDARPFADELGDVFFIDFFFQHRGILLHRGKPLLGLLQFAFCGSDFAIADFRNFGQFAGPLEALLLRLELLDLLLELADFSNSLFFGLPTRFFPTGFFLQFGKFLLDLAAPFLGMRVRFLEQCLALNFELQDAALDFVDLYRQGIDLHTEAGGGFVDEVDGLVRQEAIGDIAVGESRRGEDGRIFDAHTVIHFVAFRQAAKNGNGVFDRRIANQDRLKTAFEGRILLDVFLVFIKRRGADRAQFTAGQRRLQHVRGIHGALGGAGPHERVQLVDEKDDLPFGLGDFFEDGFQAVFKLASEFCSGHEGGEVQGDNPLGLQHVRNVASNDALRQAFHDGRFADPRFAYQYRIVFGAPRKNLHHAANLFVAADDRIELLLPGQFRQVASILFQGRVSSFGILRRHPLRAAHSSQRLKNRFVRSAVPIQQLPGRIPLASGNRQEKVFGRDVVVLEPVGLLECLLENVVERSAHMLLGKPLHFGQPGDLPRDPLGQRFGVNAKPGEQGGHYAIGLGYQRRQQVNRFNLLILVLSGNLLGALHGFLRLDSHFFKSQHRNLNLPDMALRGWRSHQPLRATTFALSWPLAASGYLPEAAAATAGALTLTLICFGFASSRLGMLNVSTPF